MAETAEQVRAALDESKYDRDLREQVEALHRLGLTREGETFAHRMHGYKPVPLGPDPREMAAVLAATHWHSVFCYVQREGPLVVTALIIQLAEALCEAPRGSGVPGQQPAASPGSSTPG